MFSLIRCCGYAQASKKHVTLLIEFSLKDVVLGHDHVALKYL